MSTTRAFKIITHLSEAASLEEALFLEKDAEYEMLFKSDFSVEHEFMQHVGIVHAKPNDSKSTPLSCIREEVLKSLHKKLALKTHPDVCPDDTEEFRKIQDAFEKKDGPALLTAALRHEIDIQLDATDIEAMMTDVQKRRTQTENKKNTFRWAWAESKRDEKTKRYIRAALQIDEIKFQEWLAAKNSKA